MNKDSVRAVQDPWLAPFSSAWSHPSDLDDGTLFDFLVDAEASRTLEEGDGFPQVALGHLHQCRDTLHGHKQSVESPGLLWCYKTARIRQLPWNISLGLGSLTNDWELMFTQTSVASQEMIHNTWGFFSVTSLLYLRPSFSQISSSRSSWIWLARGLKRNLEHLEVRGSMILKDKRTYTYIQHG